MEDCYQDTYRDTTNDGSAGETCMEKFHNTRVMRGGGWNAIPAWMRSASRDVEVPTLRADTFGFRVMCTTETVAPERRATARRAPANAEYKGTIE